MLAYWIMAPNIIYMYVLIKTIDKHTVCTLLIQLVARCAQFIYWQIINSGKQKENKNMGEKLYDCSVYGEIYGMGQSLHISYTLIWLISFELFVHVKWTTFQNWKQKCIQLCTHFQMPIQFHPFGFDSGYKDSLRCLHPFHKVKSMKYNVTTCSRFMNWRRHQILKMYSLRTAIDIIFFFHTHYADISNCYENVMGKDFNFNV